ncbi:PPE domain-containing protein [Mycolicibacterium setense]|uniref:PPE domain-containing protein n=1 Tax=Mycolicibacterium setense TaxID=431269 RepID=UPI000AE1E1C1|nr:hypothetical protein [Mycolicibacterium setense]MCV7110612.1 hypothetical protein [Mycolicibacterium setense]
MGDTPQTFTKVTPSDLRAKKGEITAEWPTVPENPIAPSEVYPSGHGLSQISFTHTELVNVVHAGKAEAARLAACLEAAALAYEQVDAMNKAAIEGNSSGVDAVTLNPQLPAEATSLPNTLPKPASKDDKEFSVDWTIAVGQFNSGDQGTSLHHFAEQLNTFGNKLRDRGRTFDLANVHWEGQAAEAAEAALRQHQSWLFELAGQCDKFAEKARAFAQIHNTRKSEHPSEADIEEAKKYSPENGGLQNYFAKQQQSDNARSGYLSDLANTPHVFLDKPPKGAIGPAPVKAGDVPPLPDKPKEGSPGTNGQTGQSGGTGSGTPSSGAPTIEPSVSPASATPAEGESKAGSPSGGEGGGSPSSGGGSPAGGGGSPSTGPGSGSPSSLGDTPGLPSLDDPAVSPASSGGSPGGGGPGGGTPSSPLGPPVAAETVAPSPAGPRGPGAPGAPGTQGSMGGMGGGMGGMGGGHGQGQGGKEKRRDPNLSPDENLYVEDRAHTEGVIGLQSRRKRNPQEDKGEQ